MSNGLLQAVAYLEQAVVMLAISILFPPTLWPAQISVLHMKAFSNLQDIFIAIKSCLGIFLASLWPQDGHHRRFFGSH